MKIRLNSSLDNWLFTSKTSSILNYCLINYHTIKFLSFFPKPYWQKRGLILLLKHPKVTFTQLPDAPPMECNEALTKQELLACLNPVAICNALEQENKDWLQFFIKEHFDKKVSLGFNLMQDEEFLGKLITYKLAVLNHSSSSDMQARYILPVNTLLSNLLKFPDKLERVKTVFEKTQNDFFESYEVFELLCYLEQYEKIVIENSTFSRKRKTLFSILTKLKEFELNNFDREQITFNLETLSQLNNQYLAIKNE